MNRRNFGKLALAGGAGLTLALPRPARLLSQGYPPAPNYAALSNWLNANNTTSVINSFKGPRLNMSSYYPKDNNMNSLTKAQASVLGTCVQDWLNAVNRNFSGGSLNSAILACGQNNYQQDGWVTFVTHSWDFCYDYCYEVAAGLPYFTPVYESVYSDCWDSYASITFPVYSYPPAGSWPYLLNFDSFASTISGMVGAIRAFACGTGQVYDNYCTAMKEAVVLAAAVAGVLAAISLAFPLLAPACGELIADLVIVAGIASIMLIFCGCPL